MSLDQHDDEEAIRAVLGISSFGTQSRNDNLQTRLNQSKRQLAESRGKHPASVERKRAEEEDDDEADGSENDEEEEEDDDDDDDDEDEDEFPVSHELVLKTHDRAITSVTLDTAGGRLITGSTDCTFKLHDFASMTPTTLRAFRTVDPTSTKKSANTETHPVQHVEFNPHSPSQVLVVTALPQVKIFTRDGEVQWESVKGDMYLRDLNKTKGHISEVTSGTWHPTNRNVCVTAGTDSTVRIWDLNSINKQKDVIMFKTKIVGVGGRTRMTAVAWSSQIQGSPNILVSAALDGSLVMYSGEGPYHRPAGEVGEAHEPNSWTSGLDISADGRLIVSRGGDDTVKLWDTRKFKQPVSTAKFTSTAARFPTSNIRFSPSSSNILLGSDTGHLHILNPATLKPELSTPVTPGSPLITVLWHEKLNQIITGSANGETHVLYSPNTSNGGAKIVMSKAPKRRHVDDDPSLTMDLSQGISGDAIVTPGGILPDPSRGPRHPNIGLTASGRSRDPRRPHLPAQTPFAKNQPDEKYIKENIELSSMRDEDPITALMKYATDAQKAVWEESRGNSKAVSDEEDEPESKKARIS